MLQNLQIFYELLHRHLIVGTVLLLAYWVTLHWSWRTTLSVAFLSLTLLMGIPRLYTPYLLTLITLAAIWRLAGIRPWKFIPVAAAAMLLIQFWVANPWIRRFHELEALRDDNPPESLVDRLAYESRHVGSVLSRGYRNGDSSESGPQTTQWTIDDELERAEKRLDHFPEEEYGDSERIRSLGALAHIAPLENLHARVFAEFIEAEGLGVRRARIFDLNQPAFAIPDLPSLSMPPPPETGPESSPDVGPQQGELAQAAASAAPAHDVLRETHESSAFNFVNRKGFGYVVGPDRVYGFQPHGFRSSPTLPTPEPEGGAQSNSWQVASLQLVSLLKQESPGVYLSDSLPRMDELSHVPTRPLDAFESEALAKLQSGEQIIFESGDEEIRMLGSLRAAKQCLQCHSVERGHLLGAFTYRLHPLRSKAPAGATRTPIL
jgi:hypothetical protein